MLLRIHSLVSFVVASISRSVNGVFHVLPVSILPPVESCFSPGVDSPPAVAPMASQDEKTRPENHQENHLDA